MKNFNLLIDENSNVQKVASTVVKFSYQNKNYLIYSTEENAENSQIFVSELVCNTEGRYFIDSIKDKEKLSAIVFDIVMLTPNEYKKGGTPAILIDNLSKKHLITLSKDIPDLGVQKYCKDCSIAITKKESIELATKFFEEYLTGEIKKEESMPLPTWTVPVDNVVPNITPSINEVSTANQNIIPNFMPEVKIDPINNNNIQNINEPTTPISSMNNQVEENIPNPQMEKLAISSDPSLNSLGIDSRSVQPNLVRTKKAGFANSKYIVIGTICLLLSVAVVVAAIILIKNK